MIPGLKALSKIARIDHDLVVRSLTDDLGYATSAVEGVCASVVPLDIGALRVVKVCGPSASTSPDEDGARIGVSARYFGGQVRAGRSAASDGELTTRFAGKVVLVTGASSGIACGAWSSANAAVRSDSPRMRAARTCG